MGGPYPPRQGAYPPPHHHHPNGNGMGPPVPLPQMSFQQPMTMHDQAEAARLAQDYEALVSIIKQWNANRLDLFALTLPNEVGQVLHFMGCKCSHEVENESLENVLMKTNNEHY